MGSEREVVNMRPNAKKLAMRDPAMAALMGIVAMGTDFGSERSEPSSFNGEFGSDFGDDDFEGDDDDWGAEFGAAIVKAKPTPTKVAQVWQKHAAGQALAQRRNMLLEPNKGSAIKVERYTFNLDQAIALGTSATLSLNGQPDTTIRPQRVTMNAPCMGFASIGTIKVANVNVTVGSGSEDAYNYNANGVGQSLDMPTLSPSNRATVTGNYNGFIPPGYVSGFAYLFSVSFKGPAAIVA